MDSNMPNTSDEPVITEQMINDYIRKRNLRRAILVVAIIAVIASAIAAVFIIKANEAAEERKRAEEISKFLNNKNLITYNDKQIILASDLSTFLKNFGLYYDSFTVRGKRTDKKTDLNAFLNSDKCVSSSASWKGWLGTAEKPKMIEINAFIKSGDADSCVISNMRVDSVVLRSGKIKKGEYEIDISNVTADEVLDYLDIEDSLVRGVNNSRVIRLKDFDTEDYTVEFWYDENIYSEDPVKFVFTYTEKETE